MANMGAVFCGGNKLKVDQVFLTFRKILALVISVGNRKGSKEKSR